MDALNAYYLNLEEPKRSFSLALRDLILSYDEQITEVWKYRLPFFEFKGKMFCYLWQDKITNMPYVGVCRGHLVDHPNLIKGDRKKIKVLSLDMNKDIPVGLIYEVFDLVRGTYGG